MKVRSAAVAAGLALGLMSCTAHAAYIISVEQAGANVVATGQGSFNLAGLTNFNTGQAARGLLPADDFISVGYVGTQDLYTGLNGPSSLGGPVFSSPTFETGTEVLLIDQHDLALPAGYTSDTALGLSTSSFNDTTISALGLASGTYKFTFGSGADADSLTIIVGNGISTVPLPASAPMFGAALLALGAVGYGVKRKAKAAA